VTKTNLVLDNWQQFLYDVLTMKRRTYVRFFERKDAGIPEDTRFLDYWASSPSSLVESIQEWLERHPLGKVEFISKEY
jgi:hypothetical protein